MSLPIIFCFFAFAYNLLMFFIEGGFDLKIANRLFWTVLWLVILLYLVNVLALFRLLYRVVSVENAIGNSIETNRRITDYFDENQEEPRFLRKRLS